jgi:hypothetical protein
MKPMWFHLMPHTEFSGNGRGKHPAAWVDIQASLSIDREHHNWPRSMDSAQPTMAPPTMAAE